MSKLDTTIIGEKHGKIDARVEKWIIDEKKDCKESLIHCINGWNSQEENTPMKVEILEGLKKELETGEKQLKNYNIEL